MKLFDKECYQLMEHFERTVPGVRREKEPKDLWKLGSIYQHGETNEKFLLFRSGYALGKTVGGEE